jgi:hypothetical protein
VIHQLIAAPQKLVHIIGYQLIAGVEVINMAVYKNAQMLPVFSFIGY